MTTAALSVGLVDMNNGHPNQAIRSFRTLIGAFLGEVRLANPGLETRVCVVQPRNLGEGPPPGCDLYLSTGGPGSPVDGLGETWCPAYRAFLDRIVDQPSSAAALLVCYSFEIAVLHLGVADITPRARKFGIMPVYPTEGGMRSELLGAFGDRFFAWEHRNWQAVDLDKARLAGLGGELLARESRDGVSKGPGMVAFRFTPSLEGTIFHPEADRPGALAWIEQPEQAAAVVESYGEVTYRRMLRTLDDPQRLARTYALLIPGWLARRFNALCPERGWQPIPTPTYDGRASAAFSAPSESPTS